MPMPMPMPVPVTNPETIKINDYQVLPLKTLRVECTMYSSIPWTEVFPPLLAFFKGPIQTKTNPSKFRNSRFSGCMYSHHILYQEKDQPGKVANPARGQLNRENKYSTVPVRA